MLYFDEFFVENLFFTNFEYNLTNWHWHNLYDFLLLVECEYGIYPAGIFIDSCAANSLFTRHEIGRHAKKEVWIRISVFRFFILLFFLPFQSSRSLSSASIYPNLSILFRPQESFECVCVFTYSTKKFILSHHLHGACQFLPPVFTPFSTSHSGWKSLFSLILTFVINRSEASISCL